MTNEMAANKIVVKSDDTDVLILLLYYYWNDRQLNSCKIFMGKGHSITSTNKKRFIPVHLLAEVLGKSICGGLPAFHALTGCDTTNAFFKIGKKSAWQLFHRKNIDLQDFGKIIENSINIGRKLIVHLYRKEKCENLDEIRLMLTKEDTKKSAKELPPTEDSFKLHAQSHNGMREEMDPQDYGWMKNKDMLIPKFSTKPPIPDEIRKLISLFCTEKNCNTTKCVCKTEGMFCSLECKCSMSCTNSPNLEEEEEEEDISKPLE
ncbi:unnamed protein product [Ceutorhynchus assimilis]|uniref:Tesmin/TSO1-like CXC domain-containing protein n=1 Tax=Ceutorhynchus assimilis TaxID=467358 RepID=A0A9N9MT81_9CUCU|nr:unnamed protein product [Ceutorhynchus assimilis]